MHALKRVEKEVNATHPRLGSAAAFAMLCAKARKCLMIVAPAGTGKSSICRAAVASIPDSFVLDSVTRSGLKHFEDRFTGYEGLVVIDDMGKIDTMYGRLATVTTFAELCYSHFVEKHTITTHLEIRDFNGAAILNIQPPILAQVMSSDDWEAVTQDKTIRYYHLFRPSAPVNETPVVKLKSEVEIADVKLTGQHGAKWKALCELGYCQWSDARTLEHVADLLKAAAAWDGRTEVTPVDYKLLQELMKPLALERHLLSRLGFEQDRRFELNLLAMLVELSSWKGLTIERICRDYKVNAATVLRVLTMLPEYFEIGRQNPEMIVVLPKCKAILKELGVRR